MGLATLAFAAAALLATPALGQVVRETDTSSLAGLLDAYWNPADSFTFSSRGGEILFADVDAEIYQVRGRKGGDHEDDEGDCGGHSADEASTGATHDDEGHTDDGGPGGLCLQVLDAMGNMLCWADRPARPGWQRDPALACPLPAARGNAAYQLRVSLKVGGCGPGGSGGHPTSALAAPMDGPGTPYVLNWSLRRIATDGQLQNQANRANP
jgi:hypothetical protein